MLRRPARCGAALKARGALPRLDGEPSLAVAGANATIVGWGATYDDSGHGQVEGVPCRWTNISDSGRLSWSWFGRLVSHTNRTSF